MATMTATAVDAMKGQLSPVLEKLEEGVRDGRRVIVRAAHAAEDGAAAAALRVRRHPLRAIGLAAGIGAIAGCIVGYAVQACRGESS